MKTRTSWIALAWATLALTTACGAGADNGTVDQAKTDKVAVAGKGQALKNVGGGGGESCPGGGSPSCTQCSDGETCVYSCAGGYACNISDLGNGGSLCTVRGSCLSFSGGWGGGHGRIAF